MLVHEVDERAAAFLTSPARPQALTSFLRDHPWMAGLVIERLVPLPNYLRALAVMLQCTREAGLDPESGAVVVQHAVQAVVAVVEHTPGPHPPDTTV